MKTQKQKGQAQVPHEQKAESAAASAVPVDKEKSSTKSPRAESPTINVEISEAQVPMLIRLGKEETAEGYAGAFRLRRRGQKTVTFVREDGTHLNTSYEALEQALGVKVDRPIPVVHAAA